MMLFVCLIVAATIAAFFVWAFACHCFMSVIEETAAGNRDVSYPDDPYSDWIWKGWYLAWLVAVWVAPALLLAYIVSPAFAERWRGPAYVLVAAGAFWLAFPLSLLSSLAAESRLTVLHGGVLARLVRRPGTWLAFLLLSALAVLPAAGAIAWEFFGNHLASLLVAPLVVAASVFLYARLAGRLAQILQLVKLPKRHKKKLKRNARRTNAIQTTDPWHVPEEPATFVQPTRLPGLPTPFEGEVLGYDVSFDEPQKSTADCPAPAKIPEAAELHDVRDQWHTAEHRAAREAAARIKPDAVELAHQQLRENKPPPMTWFECIASLPSSSGVIRMYAFVTIGLLVLTALVRGVRLLAPF